MSRTTDKPLTPSAEFLLYFEHSHLKDFSFWVEFSRKALLLYGKEKIYLNNRIKALDKELLSGIELDGNGNRILYDAWDINEDEVFNLENQDNEILPLMFIGAYKDFEKKLKDLVEGIFNQIQGKYDAKKINKAQKTIGSKKEYKFISDVDSVLSNSGLISIKETSILSEKWTAIENYKELRNVFAHNDFPLTDNKRLEKIRTVVGENVTDKGYILTLPVDLIPNTCNLYTEFMNLLILKIAEKVFT